MTKKDLNNHLRTFVLEELYLVWEVSKQVLNNESRQPFVVRHGRFKVTQLLDSGYRYTPTNDLKLNF